MLSWLRLIRSHRVGPSTFARLMAEHADAEAALAALPGMARASGVRDYVPCPLETAEAELAAAQACGAFPLCLGDPRYPAPLAAIPDAPPLLWARGNAAALALPAVAIVGARNASSLGQRMARALAEGLGRQGYCVVSGLARGIDAAAHGAARDTGTVAVLAGGVDRIYPAENAALAQALLDRGLLLSEQPMGLDAQARHFPRRNRLISGLSLGVVVVEAAPRSGSLITVRDALEQGREVMAVPGHPFDGRAGGCNSLIRDGATLVRDAADVVSALGRGQERHPTTAAAQPVLPHIAAAPAPDPPRPDRAKGQTPQLQARRAPPSTAQPGTRAPGQAMPRADSARDSVSHPDTPPPSLAGRILDRLGPSPVTEDQLIRDLALPAGVVAQHLLLMELDGHVIRQPGGMVARTV